MKAELRAARHAIGGEVVVEIWFADALVAMLYPAEGAGVRVISKLPMLLARPAGEVARVASARHPNLLEVQFVLPCPPDAA